MRTIFERLTYGDHWIFNGARSSSGYGCVKVDGQVRSVHRLVYEAFKGEIPDSRVVDHRCHQRRCVRPRCLRLLTREANAADQLPRRPATHCRAGHPFAGDNVIHRADGSRRCRACKNRSNSLWMRNYRARQIAATDARVVEVE